MHSTLKEKIDNHMKGVYIFLADGFEDIEALGTNDVLRRGGVQTCLVGIGDEPFVMSSKGVAVGVDLMLSELDTDHAGTSEEDVMIFPGGMPGTRNLADCKPLMKLMQEHYDAGGSLAAICAAPGFVLSKLEGIEGVRFTCYDGCGEAAVAAGGLFDPQPAVTHGRIITGRGPGYALEFGLELLRKLRPEKVEQTAFGLFLR